MQTPTTAETLLWIDALLKYLAAERTVVLSPTTSPRPMTMTPIIRAGNGNEGMSPMLVDFAKAATTTAHGTMSATRNANRA